uniref:Uncharacterized protein n=1 Tax=viral metagenome TaxID=1070528 RepID=A0A6M3JX66_9ZZZZ
MTTKARKLSKGEQQIQDAAERLRRYVGKPDGEVRIYTVLNHVARSRMMRKISAYIIVDNKPVGLCYEVKMSGTGMDMGFALAYEIFLGAYGHDDAYRYQDHLRHEWL